MNYEVYSKENLSILENNLSKEGYTVSEQRETKKILGKPISKLDACCKKLKSIAIIVCTLGFILLNENQRIKLLAPFKNLDVVIICHPKWDLEFPPPPSKINNLFNQTIDNNFIDPTDEPNPLPPVEIPLFEGIDPSLLKGKEGFDGMIEAEDLSDEIIEDTTIVGVQDTIKEYLLEASRDVPQDDEMNDNTWTLAVFNMLDEAKLNTEGCHPTLHIDDFVVSDSSEDPAKKIVDFFSLKNTPCKPVALKEKILRLTDQERQAFSDYVAGRISIDRLPITVSDLINELSALTENLKDRYPFFVSNRNEVFFSGDGFLEKSASGIISDLLQNHIKTYAYCAGDFYCPPLDSLICATIALELLSNVNVTEIAYRSFKLGGLWYDFGENSEPDVAHGRMPNITHFNELTSFNNDDHDTLISTQPYELALMLKHKTADQIERLKGLCLNNKMNLMDPGIRIPLVAFAHLIKSRFFKPFRENLRANLNQEEPVVPELGAVEPEPIVPAPAAPITQPLEVKNYPPVNSFGESVKQIIASGFDETLVKTTKPLNQASFKEYVEKVFTVPKAPSYYEDVTNPYRYVVDNCFLSALIDALDNKLLSKDDLEPRVKLFRKQLADLLENKKEEYLPLVSALKNNRAWNYALGKREINEPTQEDLTVHFNEHLKGIRGSEYIGNDFEINLLSEILQRRIAIYDEPSYMPEKAKLGNHDVLFPKMFFSEEKKDWPIIYLYRVNDNHFYPLFLKDEFKN